MKRDPNLLLENETLGDTTQTIEVTGYKDWKQKRSGRGLLKDGTW